MEVEVKETEKAKWNEKADEGRPGCFVIKNTPHSLKPINLVVLKNLFMKH